jgi:hypothetical protein
MVKLEKIYYNNYKLKIRGTKHELITRVNEKMWDESIKTN